MEYAAYTGSISWNTRKAAYYRSHKKKCRACRRTGFDVHLHHLSYENLGREPDSDLMPLCSRCHYYVHRQARANRTISLRETTERVVLAIQASPPVARRGKQKTRFVPTRQRMTLEERRNDPNNGKSGRLGGLPIVSR